MENTFKIQFYCYNNCSTCKKAEKYLKDNNIVYKRHEIVTDIPKKEDIKRWMKRSGKDLKKFFNTSGNSYKKLGLSKTYNDYTEDELINMLSKDGMLIKRPILVLEDDVLLGFKKEEYDNALGI